jgi:sugar O-acyltransferase (sialic acid O-acetyltransferase NeuD family)
MEVTQLLDNLFQVGCGSFHDELKICYLDANPDNSRRIIAIDDFNEDCLGSDSIPEGADVLVSIGNVEHRRDNVNLILNKRCKFPNVISNRFHLLGNPELGHGVYALGHGSLSVGSRIGNFTIIHGFAVIGHHVKIGDYVNVGAGSFIGGGCQVGNQVSIGPNSTILPGIKIADGCDIAAGSVVLRNLRENSRVYGNPAKSY